MELLKLKTLDGEVVFDDAVQEEHNMLLRLTYGKRNSISCYVSMNSGANFKALVLSHLGLKRPEDCQVTQPVDWIHGSFNICQGFATRHGAKDMMATLSVGYRYQNSNDESSQMTAFDVIERGFRKTQTVAFFTGIALHISILTS